MFYVYPILKFESLSMLDMVLWSLVSTNKDCPEVTIYDNQAEESKKSKKSIKEIDKLYSNIVAYFKPIVAYSLISLCFNRFNLNDAKDLKLFKSLITKLEEVKVKDDFKLALAIERMT